MTNITIDQDLAAIIAIFLKEENGTNLKPKEILRIQEFDKFLYHLLRGEEMVFEWKVITPDKIWGKTVDKAICEYDQWDDPHTETKYQFTGNWDIK